MPGCVAIFHSRHKFFCSNVFNLHITKPFIAKSLINCKISRYAALKQITILLESYKRNLFGCNNIINFLNSHFPF